MSNPAQMAITRGFHRNRMTAMQDTFLHRPLGRTGLSVNAMALGCYSMSNAYGKRSEEESVAVVRRALDEGIDLLDTADYYGWGHNERLVASALAGRRDEVLISSKFGYVLAEGGTLGVRGDPRRTFAHAAKHPCGVSIPIASIFTSSIASIRMSRSRRPSAPWSNLCTQAKCAISGCAKSPKTPCGAPARCIPSRRCRRGIHSGRERLRLACWRFAPNSVSP